MTCVVGLWRQGRVWLGADSATVHGEHYEHFDVRAEAKVFRVGPLLIGGDGSPRIRQLVEYEAGPALADYFRQADSSPGDYHMVRGFVPILRAVLKEHGAMQREDSGEDIIDADLLVGWRGQLWNIGADFQMHRSLRPYMAIGSGGAYALGALHTDERLLGQETETATWDLMGRWAERALARALDAASSLCSTVAPPFTILTAPEQRP